MPTSISFTLLGTLAGLTQYLSSLSHHNNGDRDSHQCVFNEFTDLY